MNSFLLIIFLFTIVICFYIERRARSITVLLWPILFFYVWLPLFFEETKFLNNFKSNDLFFPLIFCTIFTIFYAFAFLTTLYILRGRPITYDVRSLNLSPQIIFSCIILIFLFLFISGIDATAFISSTWQSKRDLGIYTLFIFWLLATLSGQFFLCIMKKRYIFSTVINDIRFDCSLFPTRAVIGILLFPFLIHFMRLRNLRIGLIFSISTVIFSTVIILRLIRFQGELRDLNFSTILYQISSDLARETFEGGDLSIYKYLISLGRDCDQYLACFNFSFFQTIFDKFGLIDYSNSRLTYYLFDIYFERGIGSSRIGYIYGDFNVIGGTFFMMGLGAFHALISKIKSNYQILIIGFFSQYIIFLGRGSVFNAGIDLFVGFLFLMGFMISGKYGFGRAFKLKKF